MPDPTTEEVTPTPREIDVAARAVLGAKEALDDALVALGKKTHPDEELGPEGHALRKYGAPGSN
jgi:hypothetical protein